MRSFVKIKPLRIGNISLSFTDIGKSCPVPNFFTSQMCLLTLFAKLKFSLKFPNLQYWHKLLICVLHFYYKISFMGAQWLSAQDRGAAGSSLTGVTVLWSLSKTHLSLIYSLVLVQPRKMCPFITERLLMGRKESNQTNKTIKRHLQFAADNNFKFCCFFKNNK